VQKNTIFIYNIL